MIGLSASEIPNDAQASTEASATPAAASPTVPADTSRSSEGHANADASDETAVRSPSPVVSTDPLAAAKPVTDPVRRRRRRILLGVLALWGICVVVALLLQARYALGSISMNDLEQFRTRLQEYAASLSPPLLVAGLVAIYLVRPLVFFPSSVMGIACGFLFGPLTGTLLTLSGEALGANVAFSVGRSLGRDAVRRADQKTTAVAKFVARWDRRLSEQGFLTTALVRLIMLPFDMVSYASGLTGIHRASFTAGTLVGGFPGFVFFPLLGGSQSAAADGTVEFLGTTWSIRFLLVTAAVVLLAFGVALGTWLRRRTQSELRQPEAEIAPRHPEPRRPERTEAAEAGSLGR